MAAVATWTRRTYGGNPYASISAISTAGGIATSRTTGETPFFFSASASAITCTGSSRPYEDIEYTWTLEREDGGGGWEAITDGEGITNPVSDSAYNTYTDQQGPEAAFVIRDEHLVGGAQTDFRLTLTCRAWNGSAYVTETVTETITVDPFDGVKIYVDATNGSNTNDGRDPHGFNLSTATYTHSNRTINATGAFSGYTYAGDDSDVIYIDAATGGVAVGLYTIESKTDNDNIVLAAASGLTADATGVGSSNGPEQTFNNTYVTSDRDILLKRGETFDVGAGVTFGNGFTGVRMRAYGTGAKPIIQGTASGTFVIRSNINGGDYHIDWVLSDLDIDGNANIGTGFALSGNGAATGCGWRNVYLDNVDIHDSTGLSCHAPDLNSADYTENFGLWKCTLLDNTDGHGVLTGNGQPWQFFMATAINGETTDVADRDHHMYVNLNEHALFDCMSFGTATNRSYCINLNREAGGSLEHRWGEIRNCDFDGTSGCKRGFDCSNSSNETDDGNIEMVVVHDNALHSLSNDAVLFYNGEVTFRDNVLFNTKTVALGYDLASTAPQEAFLHAYANLYYKPGTQSNQEAFKVNGNITTACRLSHNAIHDASTTARFVETSPTNQSSNPFDYNTFYSPNDSDGDVFYDADGATGVTFAEWQGLGFDANSVTTDPNFTDPANGDFTGYTFPAAVDPVESASTDNLTLFVSVNRSCFKSIFRSVVR